jgi:hypothetical protein
MGCCLRRERPAMPTMWPALRPIGTLPLAHRTTSSRHWGSPVISSATAAPDHEDGCTAFADDKLQALAVCHRSRWGLNGKGSLRCAPSRDGGMRNGGVGEPPDSSPAGAEISTLYPASITGPLRRTTPVCLRLGSETGSVTLLLLGKSAIGSRSGRMASRGWDQARKTSLAHPTYRYSAKERTIALTTERPARHRGRQADACMQMLR